MKKLLSIILMLFAFASHSQNLDSLYAVIEGDGEDTTRIKTMLYTSQVLQQTDAEEAEMLANNASILSVENKEYEWAAKSFNQLGLLSYYSGNFKSCKGYFEEALLYYEMAEIPLGIASAKNNLGVIEYEQGFFYNALNLFAESLVLRKAEQDSASISVSYNNIGNVYKDLNQFFKAEEFYQKSIDMKEVLGDEYGLAMTYNNLGQVYHELESYDTAIKLYEKSIAIKVKLDDQHGLGMTYANLGNSLKEKGDLEEAQEKIEKSIEIRTFIKDDFGLMHSKMSLAQLLIEKNNLTEAEDLFLQSLSTAKKQQAFVQEKDSYFGLSEIYEKNGNFEKSLFYHKRYSQLNDSINSAENLKVAKQVETELDVADKEEQIVQLTKEINNQKPFWKEAWFEFVLFFSVMCILVFVIFYFIRDKSKKEETSNYSSKQISVLRLLFLAAALAAPVLGYFRSQAVDSIFDPLWLRITVSTVMLIPLIASYKIERVKKSFPTISLIYYYGLTIFLFYFAYKNDLSPVYLIDAVILNAAAPVVFTKLKQYTLYCILYLSFGISFYLLLDNPLIAPGPYFISIVFSLGVIYLTILGRLKSLSRMALSDEIVNEVDALVFIANDQGETVYVSNSINKILGYSPEEVLLDNWYMNIGFTKEEYTKMKQGLAIVARGESSPLDSEFQPFITKNGDVKWILWKNVRIEGNRVLGIGQDVTDRKIVLDELKESESKFRTINDTLSDVFYLYNIDARKYEYISPACKNVLGETADFFYNGKSHKDKYVVKEDYDIVAAANKKVDSGQSYDIEYRIIINKEVRWINEKSYPIKDEFGHVVRNSGVCNDITDFKSSQEELKKLSLVASNTTNYVIIAHVENGIEWVNEAFLKTFGYEPGEVIGKFPSVVLHNEKSKVAELINEVVFQQGEKFSGELIHYTKNNQKIHAKVDVIPLKNRRGEVEKYFVLGVNLSEQKEQEKVLSDALQKLSVKERELKKSEINFRHLIKSIKQVFWLSDFNTKEVLFVSDSYQKVFGYTGETLKENPKSWSEPIHPEDKERVVQAFSQFGGKGEFDEVYRVLVGKKCKWVHSRTFQVLDDNGEVIMLSGITEDITEKRLKDIELQKLTSRLGVIHQIENTILTSESSEDIIYNTLNKTLQELPILRSSLALFDYNHETFYSYTAKENNELSLTDSRVFNLSDFSALNELNEKRSPIVTNIKKKKVKSKTDEILIQEGVTLSVMSPLVYGNELIGSFNVCFRNDIEDEATLNDYIEVAKEVANGLALAIQQSKLKEEIVVKNKDITSSINYSKMIQDAHLPLDLNHNGLLPDHFLYFKPKDIVSGDFYWTEQIGDDLILIVGDCTGHGVPGGFMTVIGINQIQHIVSQEGEADPGRILQKLNERIKNSLSSKREIQINDGMDVSVCVLNKKAKTFKYAGAKRPLIAVTDGNMLITQGDKFSIGSEFDNSKYETREIHLGKKNQFYVFSDGYPDQFGGPNHRKFNRKRTIELIEQIHELPIAKQLEIVEETHENWKGKRSQTDDIVFAGFSMNLD